MKETHRKNGSFDLPIRPKNSTAASLIRVAAIYKTISLGLSSFPDFVPNLSWQIFSFWYTMRL